MATLAQSVLIAVTLEAGSWAFAKGKRKALLRMQEGATVGEFLVLLRSKLPALAPEEAVYAFWNGAEIAAMHTPLSHLIKKHKSRNGQLPVSIRAESTFGG